MTVSNKNWKLHAVRKKAANLAFRIGSVRKIFGPRHVQDRIYMNGNRCHLLPGLPLHGDTSWRSHDYRPSHTQKRMG
jgi:hypothetical protein